MRGPGATTALLEGGCGCPRCWGGSNPGDVPWEGVGTEQGHRIAELPRGWTSASPFGKEPALPLPTAPPSKGRSGLWFCSLIRALLGHPNLTRSRAATSLHFGQITSSTRALCERVCVSLARPQPQGHGHKAGGEASSHSSWHQQRQIGPCLMWLQPFRALQTDLQHRQTPAKGKFSLALTSLLYFTLQTASHPSTTCIFQP